MTASVETQIQKETDGAIIPNGTRHLTQLITVALMVPMSRSGPTSPECDWGLPIVLWGLSGIGKSDRARQGSLYANLPYRLIFPSQKQPEDFASLPVVLQDQLRTACMLSSVNELNREKGGGVIIIEEVSCATPATQGSLLGFVLDRTVGDTKVNSNVRFLLTANPPKYAAGGFGLEAPLANRMAHFYIFAPSIDDWCKWLIDESPRKVDTIESMTAKIQKKWVDNWSQMRGLASGFMQSNPTLFQMQPEASSPQAGYCWPSPRSWTMGFRAAATVRSLDMDRELEQMFIEACVGEGAAQEWCEWVAKADLPDPREVLNKGWQIDKNRLDKVMAVYSGITSLVLSVPDKKEKYHLAALAWRRLGELIKFGLSDIAFRYSTSLVENGLGSTSPGVPTELKNIAESVVYDLAQRDVVKHI